MKRKILFTCGICCLCCTIFFVGYIQIPLSKDVFSVRTGTSLKITDRYGTVLRETLSVDGGRRTWRAYANIPEVVIKTVVDTEDRRFFSHPGVDPLALIRAVFQNILARRVISGGSTITQQLVKNRLGYPRTLFGKLKEMMMALRLEQSFSKEDILTHYLNRVSFSNQVFGIEAAAKLYFNKPATHLTLAESVFLIGLIQAPSRYNPYRHVQRALVRQQRLLARMYQRGSISEAVYQIAVGEAIRLTPKKVNFKAPHFCEVILERLKETGKDGGAPSIVKTTLDYYLQEQVEEIISARIEDLENYNVTNAAVLVLDNHRGDILAYAGSTDFFDGAISGQVNGIIALRQPGSTLKPFTYQLALERSYTPATLLPDIRDFPSEPRSFIPENYDRKFHGPVRLREALACSYNLPAVRVLEKLGVDALYNRLHEFGFASLQELPAFYGSGLTLGNGEVTLLELTKAYSILARRGKAIQERYTLETSSLLNSASTPFSMTDPDVQSSHPASHIEEPLRSHPERSRRTQLFAPRIIYLLTHILADRQAAVPAFGESTPLELPFPTAVKTGTSKDYRDNWTVGFTKDYTVGVWVGNFDGTPMRKVSGISGAAPIYRDVMLMLYRHHNPSGLLENLPSGIASVRICPLSGKRPNYDCPYSIEELFLEGTEPAETCQMHKAYWVDSRDGLLTASDALHAVKRTFIHFPPLYQTWAHEMGYPVSPTQASSYVSTSSQAPFESAQANMVRNSPPQAETVTRLIQIVHPNDGDVYAIDPVLRQEFQTLQLSAVVDPEIPSITWYINAEPLETVETPFRTAWQIVPGTHLFYAAGQYHGKMLRSGAIMIHVVE